MRQVTGKTKIVGVFGWPVEHSLSPPMHNAAYEEMGLDYVYVPFPVRPEELEPAIAGLMALGARGANLTIPHKQNVIPLLDEVSLEARQIGAVNTIRIDEGRLLGFNTDLKGFVRAVEETGITMANQRVVLLGAGGVARAMGFGAAHSGAQSLSILNRTVSKAQKLAADIAADFSKLKVEATGYDDAGARASVEQATIVVNSTSVGMHPDDGSPVPVDWLSPETFVYDTIYNRLTPLLQAAKDRGCRTLGGATMLVHQGAEAVEIWSGRRPNTETMLNVLLAELKHRQNT